MYEIITFRDGKRFEVDLKVPITYTINKLLDVITEVYGIEFKNNQKLQAEPLGIVLKNDQTLQEQNVSGGSLLTLI